MKLQFKDQAFQAEAAAAVCDVFQGQPYCDAAYRREQHSEANAQTAMEHHLTGFRNNPLSPALTPGRLLENLRAVQRRANLPPSDELTGPGINLSVEMETGTGKTYTYVKTMYELNLRYGWSKFIIVVPSVAVREGVYQFLKTAQSNFAEKYRKKMQFFIYNSERLGDIDAFAFDPAISVMIINMQAFNSTKSRRIIDDERDAFHSRKPIDVIAGTNPILIIDEPQNVGRQTKEGLKRFRPLFTLRYSATHKEKFDLVYRLDAIDAYNLRLVKKIAALGVTVQGGDAQDSFVYLEGVDVYPEPQKPCARLYFEVRSASGVKPRMRAVRVGDDLFRLSHGLEEYADNFVVTSVNGAERSVAFLNGLKLCVGQIHGNKQALELQRRVQIRETIRTHIQRERELYPRGIKVLSLFFIDEVKKYRDYAGDNEDGRNGLYAQMFEEEYKDIVAEMQGEMQGEAYLRYLNGIDVRRTHQGYFSIDKRKGKKPRFVEGKIDSRTLLSDDTDAYDLIMRDKERLLSLDEPVRFLFSHSALREGWDNPNVFQICTLKKQSQSEIRSRQEIGRGLRLCVNQRGERMDAKEWGDDVQKHNKLTVVTDLSFGEYAAALQEGLATALSGRPQKVEPALFLGQTLLNDRGEQVRVTQAMAEAIYEDLVACGYARRGVLTDRYFEDKQKGAVAVAEEAAGCAASILRILGTVFDGRALQPEDAHASDITAELDADMLKHPLFVSLWDNIRHKSFYSVSFDAGRLIDAAVHKLDEQLNVAHVAIRQEYGEQADKLESREQVKRGDAFRRIRFSHETARFAALGSVRYDLIGKLVEETGLTRATIAAILKGISAQRFSLFQANPEGFLLKAASIINDCKAREIVQNIHYNRLDAAYDLNLFTASGRRGKLRVNAAAACKGKSLYNYTICDSAVELRFAQELDESDKVRFYVKLPGSFFIPTPVGQYSPDWGIVYQKAPDQSVFCVIETKGSVLEGELRGVETAKIACAKAHFAAVGNQAVLFAAVKDFSQVENIIDSLP